MNKKQTAVSWIMHELEKSLKGISNCWKEEFEQALQMEREQIEEAFSHGLAEEYYDSGLTKSEYYTQTYGECTHKS